MGCEIYARGKQQELEEKGGQTTENEETLHEEENNDNSENVAQTVGHNMYILAYQVGLRLHFCCLSLLVIDQLNISLSYLYVFILYVKWKSTLRYKNKH